jgi:hypothetical protein
MYHAMYEETPRHPGIHPHPHERQQSLSERTRQRVATPDGLPLDEGVGRPHFLAVGSRRTLVPVDSEPELLGDQPVRLPRVRRVPEPLEPLEPPGPPVGRVRRLPAWLLVGAVLVALAGALVWHADQRARRQESVALTACQQQLHEATILTDLQLGSVAGGLRARSAQATHAAQAAVMSTPARRVLPHVVDADRTCRSVSVRPWHLSLEARREAVTAYSSALAAKLRAVVADGQDYYRDDPSLRRLRRAADIGVIGGRY